jgi:hypothetical protein
MINPSPITVIVLERVENQFWHRSFILSPIDRLICGSLSCAIIEFYSAALFSKSFQGYPKDV